jgi:hypothetical protein
MQGLKYACRNKEEGCPEQMSLDMITDHDNVCQLGIHECPANKILGGSCTWKGNWDDFEKHVFQVHKKKVSKSPYEFSSINNSWECISTEGKLFFCNKCNKIDDYGNDMWYCTVLMIGTRAEAAKYKTVFTLTAENGVDSNVDTRCVWSFTEELDVIHSSSRCFSLSNHVMNNFIMDGRMNMKIEITDIISS